MAKVSNAQIYKLKLWEKRSEEIKRLVNEKLVPNPRPEQGMTLFEANKRTSEILGLFLHSSIQEADAAAISLIEELKAL